VKAVKEYEEDRERKWGEGGEEKEVVGNTKLTVWSTVIMRPPQDDFGALVAKAKERKNATKTKYL